MSSTTFPSVNLSRAAMIRLLDSMMRPNPEDPDRPRGPLDPIGPVSRIFGDISWAALNPQPLPPVAGPSPDPWRLVARSWAQVAGPGPEPWLSAFQARMVIDQAVAFCRAAEALGSEQAERSFEAARIQIRHFVDDYCGTPPRRWPRPWPWPLGTGEFEIDPVNLLFAGAQFHKAAAQAVDTPLHADLAAAADQLFDTGMSRMDGR